jgi:DNA-binding NarL/FixJ family response regulator
MAIKEDMKVFIADDSPLVRERLINLLSDLREIEIVGEAENTLEAIDAIRRLQPEAVILDIQMAGGSGIDVLRHIKRDEPAPTVIMLTNYSDSQYRKRCTEARADFFLDKSTEFEKVMDVLRGLIGSPEFRGETAPTPGAE